MRHAIGLGVVLLLVATGEALAAGNVGPPCRYVSWVPTGNMINPRFAPAATLLPSGKVLVTGGNPGGGKSSLATAELYDPATGTWSATGSMSLAREFHTMTLLPTGKVLVAGGVDYGPAPPAIAELYDPDTGQWTKTGAMLLARLVGHTATLLPTGKVLVVGGRGGGDNFGHPSANAELYDPATGEWHPTGALSTERTYHTATLLASGQVLVLGGLDGNAIYSASAELYDPSTGTWTPVAPMLAARLNHTATRLRSDAVLVAGGFVPSSVVTMEAEIYDPAAGTWRRTGSLFAPHGAHTATLLPSGKVLIVDGVGVNAVLPNTELFDPESVTWSDAGCTVIPRVGHTATLLPSGAVLVAGGSEDSSAELYGIIVSPGLVSLPPGASQTFGANGGSGLGYVWSFVHNESGGNPDCLGGLPGRSGGRRDRCPPGGGFVRQFVDRDRERGAPGGRRLHDSAPGQVHRLWRHRRCRPPVAGGRNPASPWMALAESPATPHALKERVGPSGFEPLTPTVSR